MREKIHPLRHLFYLLPLFCLVALASVPFAHSADLSSYKRPDRIPTLRTNKLTPERIELGKKLFFDPRLSGDNTMSCSSCHKPENYWTDNLPTAVGNKKKVLSRATPSIINSAFNSRQFWDGRALSLEMQSIMPITAPDEMNQDMNDLIEEIAAIEGYKKMFKTAYRKNGVVNKSTIARAIAAFQRSTVATDSPFDRWVAGDQKAVSDAAKKGFDLFEGKAKCNLCHHGFNFNDNGFHNIGLAQKGKKIDVGRYAIKKVAILKGAFKTPTLRNVTKTAPYMHNGAYNTLEEVIAHYNQGGVDRSNLDPNIEPIGLTPKDVNNLIAFLGTLTETRPDVTHPDLP